MNTSPHHDFLESTAMHMKNGSKAPSTSPAHSGATQMNPMATVTVTATATAIANANATNPHQQLNDDSTFQTAVPPDFHHRHLLFDSLQKILLQPTGLKNTLSGKGLISGVAVSSHETSNDESTSNSIQQQHFYHLNAATAGAVGAGGAGGGRGTYIQSWGAGYHGQLGWRFARGQKKYSAIPGYVHCDAGAGVVVVVRQVACGARHTACVTESGQVWTWGDGKYGQLGHHTDPSMKQIPRSVDMSEHVTIKQVACGGAHTIALTDNGMVYSWGWSKYGQTGSGDRQMIKVPKRIEHPLARDGVNVYAGSKHSIVVRKDGTVISFGCGKHGQTGHGDDVDRLEPEIIKRIEGEKIVTAGAGSSHSCFINEAGEVWLCGFGEFFHPTEEQHFFYEPKKITMPEPMRQVACGQSHNLVLSESGNVYAWGAGDYGQLGHGVKGNSSTPKLVLDSNDIAQVAAGRYHSFALSNAGILYSWGCGENGQLGLNTDDNVALPTVVTPILGTVVGQITCGEHHSVCLSAAPWTRISAQVSEWLNEAKKCMELKEEYLKKTHRGLTPKDLSKIREELRKWIKEESARKQLQAMEEEADAANEIASVQYADTLIPEVSHDVAMRRFRSTSLPGTGTGTTVDLKTSGDDNYGGDGALSRHSGQNDGNQLKLPKIASKVKTSQTASPRMRQVASADGSSPFGRTEPLPRTINTRTSATSAAATTATSMLGNSFASPFARASFLKETAAMVKRMTNVVTEKSEVHGAKELVNALKMITELRKDYDTLRHFAQNKSKRLAELKAEQHIFNASLSANDDSKEETDSRLDKLKMQLNTVMIKIGETSENKRNYEVNIAHLKEEDFEHFNQLKAIRKQNSDTTLMLKKMTEIKLQALEERDKAESELQAFKEEIASYRVFVQQQLDAFRQVLSVVHHHSHHRETQEAHRNETKTALTSARIDELSQEATNAEQEASALNEHLQQLELKLRHFEESFQRISGASGLSDPDAIINKFFFKSEIHDQLQHEVEDKQHLLAELKQEQRELNERLQSVHDGHKEQRWRDVDALAEKVRDADARRHALQQNADRCVQRLAFAQESLVNLVRALESSISLSVDNDLEELLSTEIWSVDQCTHVLQRLHVALCKIQNDIEMQEHAARTTPIDATLKKSTSMKRPNLPDNWSSHSPNSSQLSSRSDEVENPVVEHSKTTTLQDDGIISTENNAARENRTDSPESGGMEHFS